MSTKWIRNDLRRAATFMLLIVIGTSVAVAADRTVCYLPIAAGIASSELSPADDAATSRSGVLPNEALGVNESPTGADTIWQKYLAVWRAHSDKPASTSIRRWLTLPQDDEVQIATRRGRTTPKFLPWRSGSFAVLQTPHFEILSRANEHDSKSVARDLERFYWVWTQMYFPLWAGRDQVTVALSDWDMPSSSADEFLSRNASSRLSTRQRHRVVLLPDERTYQLTIAIPSIAAGRSATIAASTGFYSDTLATSFFFPQDDRSGLAHETCHQLFEEASDRQRSSRSLTSTPASLTTEDFWLIEGIAGHFESIRFGERLATLGGWDSNRLQYARYQSLVAGIPVSTVEQLKGKRHDIQQRRDLASWYSHAITRTHHAIDTIEPSGRRAALLRRLAEIYRVDVGHFLKLGNADTELLDHDQRIDAFLHIDDAYLFAHPIAATATALCLAGCDVTDQGWASLPPLTNLRWFDASRTPITDDQVARLLGDATHLDQLSLEATKITPDVRQTIRQATELRELDLSWTTIDDSVIESLRNCPQLETIWLTGTAITDAAMDTLSDLKQLTTIDVQRTRVTAAALERLRARLPAIELNPLELPAG